MECPAFDAVTGRPPPARADDAPGIGLVRAHQRAVLKMVLHLSDREVTTWLWLRWLAHQGSVGPGSIDLGPDVRPETRQPMSDPCRVHTPVLGAPATVAVDQPAPVTAFVGGLPEGYAPSDETDFSALDLWP